MFGIGLPEIILILALALIVVGPDKLPELARSVAKGVLELKKTVAGLKESFAEENPFDDVKPELEKAAQSLKDKLGDPSADGWKGLIPDNGVNPENTTDSDKDILEAEVISEENTETFAAEDLITEDTISEEQPDQPVTAAEPESMADQPKDSRKTQSKT